MKYFWHISVIQDTKNILLKTGYSTSNLFPARPQEDMVKYYGFNNGNDAQEMFMQCIPVSSSR